MPVKNPVHKLEILASEGVGACSFHFHFILGCGDFLFIDCQQND